jgi:hypothetical protein
LALDPAKEKEIIEMAHGPGPWAISERGAEQKKINFLKVIWPDRNREKSLDI